MRCILLDWIVDVHFKFKLDTETLFLTISIIDRVLELQQIPKSKLQLYGVTALFIASKYEKVYSIPHVRDLVYVCDNAYPKVENLATEGKIITLLGFDLLTTSPYRMLNIYQETAKLEPKNYMLYIQQNQLFLNIHYYNFLIIYQLVHLYLVHKIRRIHPSWSQDIMIPITGLNEGDIRNCVIVQKNYVIYFKLKTENNLIHQERNFHNQNIMNQNRKKSQPQNLQTLQCQIMVQMYNCYQNKGNIQNKNLNLTLFRQKQNLHQKNSSPLSSQIMN